MDDQVGDNGVKQFAKIEIDVVQLYAITTDNKLYRLYFNDSDNFAVSTVRFGSSCSQNPMMELKPDLFRCVLANFREDSLVVCRIFVNNRLSNQVQTKEIEYLQPPTPYNGIPTFEDIDSQVSNLTFNWTGSSQGWKVFPMLSWTGGGRITNIYMNTSDITPKASPLKTQAATP